MNNNLKKPQKEVVPIRTQLRRFSYILLVFGIFYFIPEEVLAKILTAILKFAVSIYDFISQFI